MLKAIERDEAARKAKREKVERSEPVAATPVANVQDTEPVKAAPTKAKTGKFGSFF